MISKFELQELIDQAIKQGDSKELQLDMLMSNILGRSLFSDEIMKTTHNDDFKQLELLKYKDVDGDPYPHL